MNWILKIFGLVFGIFLAECLVSLFWDPKVLGIAVLSIIGTVVFWVLYFKFIFTRAKKPIK